MLKMIDALTDVDFRQLMDVYEESNRISGSRFYPELSENLQTLYAEQDFYSYLEQYFRTPTARYAIWLDKKRYVCALRIEPYNVGLLLNALETAPEARNQGYAKCLLKAVLDNLRSNGGGILYSHISKNNFPSIKIHLDCGFQIIADQAVYLDGSVHSDAYTLSIDY
jgi:GNAT superfamily N-acetyltransferase